VTAGFGSSLASSTYGEGQGDLTLDLADLEFMDSTGIKLLITAARKLEGRGWLILRSPTAPIQRVLELVQIGRVSNVKVEGLQP
jgi:anti-anti-sigma factor